MNPLQSVTSFRKMLARRALIIVMTVVCGVALSVIFAMGREAEYEATAVIQIESPQVVTTVPGAGTTITSNRNSLRLIEQKLMSRDSVLRIIEKFDLFADIPDLTEIERVTLLREAVGIHEISDPTQAWRPDNQPSGLMITARLSDPQKVADVANEFLALALNEGKARSESTANETLAFFEEEAARVSAQITSMDQEFARFKEQNAGSLPEIVSNQREQLTRLRQTQLDLERQAVDIETSTARIRAEERTRQAQVITQQILLIEGRIAEIENNLAAAPEVERVFNMLNRERTQLQEEYRTITARRSDAAMARELENRDQTERFEVLETALVPVHADSSGKFKIVVAGLVASLMGAIGLALIMEMFSPIMRNSNQVEQELGIVPVVTIPVLKKPRFPFGRRLSILVTTGVLLLLDFPEVLKSKLMGNL